jgi:probable phosphoglycerate mutase
VRLVVARHGATANNVEQRYTGQADAPLSPLGWRQAEALAGALAGERFDLIVSSDLARARQTAQAIARRVGAQLRLDADLREVAMGAWEGLTFAEVAARYPEEVAAWQASPEAGAPLGGETIAQLRDRAARALARCVAAHPGGSVLWITHGGLIGALLCHLLGIDLAHRGQFQRDNAGITELYVDTGQALVVRLNETCHLRGLPAGEASQVL